MLVSQSVPAALPCTKTQGDCQPGQYAFNLGRLRAGREGIHGQHLQLIGKAVHTDIGNRWAVPAVGSVRERRQFGECAPSRIDPATESPGRDVPGPQPPEEFGGLRAWKVGFVDQSLRRFVSSRRISR